MTLIAELEQDSKCMANIITNTRVCGPLFNAQVQIDSTTVRTTPQFQLVHFYDDQAYLLLLKTC